MSMPLAHFAVGAAGMTVLLAAVAPRFRFDRTLIVLSGVWAMVPDAYRVIPLVSDQLQVFRGRPLNDLFWFHGTLDVADPADTWSVVVLAVAVLLVASVAADLWAAAWPYIERRLGGVGGRDADGL